MTHDYPLVQFPATSLPCTVSAASAPASAAARTIAALGSWRYPTVRRSRWGLAVAVAISLLFHGGLLLGFRTRTKAGPPPKEEKLVALNLVLPVLKDLEEPEPLPRDDNADKIDPGEYAPTLMDAPQIALPTDFVQQINFASLIPPPDLNQAKVFVIPGNIAHSGNLGDGIKNIFNLVDLDRVPEPIVQPSPVFPPGLKREVVSARVVEFLVDPDGRVLNPVVVQASYPGFEDAVMAGVSRWRFRPGMRGGKRVYTRMSVPIIFRVAESEG